MCRPIRLPLSLILDSPNPKPFAARDSHRRRGDSTGPSSIVRPSTIGLVASLLSPTALWSPRAEEGGQHWPAASARGLHSLCGGCWTNLDSLLFAHDLVPWFEGPYKGAGTTSARW